MCASLPITHGLSAERAMTYTPRSDHSRNGTFELVRRAEAHGSGEGVPNGTACHTSVEAVFTGVMGPSPVRSHHAPRHDTQPSRWRWPSDTATAAGPSPLR